MGKEGDKINGFIAQLSWDSAACKLKTFKWTDYNILLCINTLRSNDKDKEKLAVNLTLFYNAHYEANTTMTLATVQAGVKKFWQTVREMRELIYKGLASAGGNQSSLGQG